MQKPSPQTAQASAKQNRAGQESCTVLQEADVRLEGYACV
jgi:hypothetical protein